MEASKKINLIKYAAVVAAVFALLLISFKVKKPKESVTYTKNLMGTVVEITLMDGDPKRFDNAADAAFGEIRRLETLLSSYRPDSDVSRVSRSAGSMVKVSPETIEVAKAAIKVSRLSGGAFDPTVGALAGAWGYSGEKGYVPSKEEAARFLPLVDYRKITVDETASMIGLKDKGMVLNLGGIAKGYIVEKAVEVLKNEGVTRGLVHAGGDMTVFQTRTEVPFVIGIQNPREKKLLGEARLLNGAVATSGDYERYFIKNGVRYHHILDPVTGFPANRCESVTIVDEDPTEADGLSTAVFVMGPVKGMELVERLGNVEAVIVDSEGRVTVSKNFRGKIY